MRTASRSTQIGLMVLGMHRSGTSALTRVLNLLGCALPKALVGPSEGNELGHWESASAVTLNDEILASAGSSWNDWGPINADWRASGVRAQMVERATEVIREHTSLGPLFALKDPRLCRLADLWLEAADTAGADMRVVLMLRHPGEVAASLENRDLMARGYSQLLWLRHTLDAERFSRGRKRVVCRFERMLHDWRDTIDWIRRGLDLALPRNSPAAHAEVGKFLARDMRHHDAREDASLGLLAASDWLRRTFEIMQHWSEQGEDPADHAELDRIRTEFDHTYSAFSNLLMSSEFSGEFATGSHLRDQLQRQLAEVSQRSLEIERQAAEFEQLRSRESELADKIAALTAAYQTAQTRSEELQGEALALRQAAARAAELDSVAESLLQRESELAAAREATEGERKLRAGSEQELAAREAELEREKLCNAELTGRILAAESAALQRQEELAQLWDQLGTVQQAAGAATAEAAVEHDRRVEADVRLATALQDLRDLGSEKGELEIRVRIAEMALTSQRDEQLRAAGQLAEAQSQLTDLRTQLEALQRAPVPIPSPAVFDEMAQLTRLLQASESEAAAAAAACASAERRAAEQTEELTRLSALLSHEISRAESGASQAHWLREIALVAERMPKWWALMPEGWRRKREHEAYRQAGLFDAQQYLQHYSDVQAEGMDPLRHYIQHGMAEGRQMWR